MDASLTIIYAPHIDTPNLLSRAPNHGCINKANFSVQINYFIPRDKYFYLYRKIFLFLGINLSYL